MLIESTCHLSIKRCSLFFFRNLWLFGLWPLLHLQWRETQSQVPVNVLGSQPLSECLRYISLQHCPFDGFRLETAQALVRRIWDGHLISFFQPGIIHLWNISEFWLVAEYYTCSLHKTHLKALLCRCVFSALPSVVGSPTAWNNVSRKTQPQFLHWRGSVMMNESFVSSSNAEWITMIDAMMYINASMIGIVWFNRICALLPSPP